MPQPHPVITLVQDHVRRYPRMQIQDVYKLLYQAEFGNKHIVDDPQAARTRLQFEIDNVVADETEPLWEHISPDRSVLRIHLRPFKYKGLNPSHLWQAMIHAAESVTGDLDRLKTHWQAFQVGTEGGYLPFPIREVVEFWQDIELMDFPSVHHSQEYVGSYHPAYRVIGSNRLSIAIQ